MPFAATQPEPTPSTDWKEHIAPDEGQRFEAYAQAFADIQARKSEKYGRGRALHRKQLTAARGKLEVLADVPEYARHGLFAAPQVFETWVRLSNGGLEYAQDRRPDIRGFALRVLGVQGDSALGNGPARSQDFTLINQEAFAFPNSDGFVAFVVAAAHSPVALLKHLLSRYGLLGGPLRMLKMARLVARPFRCFATETFFSAVPMACGPYAVRVRLVPSTTNGEPELGASADWGADFASRLGKQSLRWELQLQPFVDEALTPIEDASVNWPTPYTTVAILTLPRQNLDSKAARAFQRKAETGVFDPWQALVEHRPLGDVQRARKVVYFTSQRGRGAA